MRFIRRYYTLLPLNTIHLMKLHKRIFSLIFFLTAFSLAVPYTAVAQISKDLSQVKVDELSDSQIQKFVQQVRATGMSESQLEQVAAARGMKSNEIRKLRERVDQLNQKKNKGKDKDRAKTDKDRNNWFGNRENEAYQLPEFQMDTLSLNDQILAEIFKNLRTRIFGHELFYNAKPQFSPNLNVATPSNYVIGFQDQLLIDLYGNSEASYELEVNREGKVNIPNIGMVSVDGISIEQARARIKNRMQSVYSSIASGETKVDVSIGEIRGIQIIMAGEVKQPGTYNLPSVATVFNALYAAGGPTEKGSLRNIKVYRDGDQVADMDVYEFLIEGQLEGNITLRDQDVVLVSPSQNRVRVDGEVNRPMYFDAREGDTFSDLLKYAGGFTNDAYTARVSVERLTDRERKIEDLFKDQFDYFPVKRGDRYTVGKTLERYANRVQIEGAVFSPGTYELTSGLTLSILIKKADGVTEDAFMKLGYINRQKENMEAERINFNVAEVLAGTQPDIQLRKEDEVHISSIFDLRDEYTVQIQGEVRNPGTYAYHEGETVKDLILEAGGFRESASTSRVEVSRRVTSTDPSENDASTAKIFHIDLQRDLVSEDDATELMPFDFITVRSNIGYETQKNVRVEGEVLYPGIYTIQSKDERISDIIQRAGGLTSYAYAKGGSLKRVGILSDEEGKALDSITEKSLTESEKFILQQRRLRNQEHEQEIKELVNDQNKSLTTSRGGQNDLEGINQASRNLGQSIKNDYVGVKIDEILKNPERNDNILVEGGDIIYIPKKLQTVRINGEVLSPVNTVYHKGASFKDYISQAGGFSQDALKRRSYIVYANGSARSTKSFLGIKSYPPVEPGADIYVPQRPERTRMSPQAWVGLGTGFASLAAIIISIFK